MCVPPDLFFTMFLFDLHSSLLACESQEPTNAGAELPALLEVELGSLKFALLQFEGREPFLSRSSQRDRVLQLFPF